jgi:hypothetical protein
VLIGVIGLLVALWALFLGTIEGNWENPVMFLPLPILCLAVLVGTGVHHWWITRRQAGFSGFGDVR